MSNYTKVVLAASKPKSDVAHRLEAQASFRVLILGDFSRQHASVVGLKPNIKVDIDNFEDVLATINPQLNLALDAHLPKVPISIRELEDFHPDALFANVPLFNEFSSLRQKLNTPATFQQASSDLQNCSILVLMGQCLGLYCKLILSKTIQIPYSGCLASLYRLALSMQKVRLCVTLLL